MVLPHGKNRIEFVEGDACDMPFPDASFDLVLAVECAFHFPSRAKFFSEVPMIIRTSPFITNITPAETMTRTIGLALCLR